MNIEKLKRALQELASATSDLAGVCEREDLPGFGPFWRSVSSDASAVLAIGSFDRAALDHLVRDVVSTFSYQPGGFMEQYIVRSDPGEQERENDVFERIRDRVRAAAGDVKEAVDEGEVDPLRIRRALVDLETAFLELGMHDDATTARELLNSPEMDHAAAAAFGDAILRHTDQGRVLRLQPLVRGLTEALRPVELE
jgi:hypothetical protein